VIVMHWAIAAAVVGLMVLGWWMQTIPKQPVGPRADAYNLHKSIGLVALLLMAVACLLVRGGERVALLGYGYGVTVARDAAEILAGHDLRPTVADARFAKPIDAGLSVPWMP
jgi:deoxyxylulose-5-phosphate synthase